MKIILITGASRGIGREIAKNLAKKGYKIIANYNKSEEAAQDLAKMSDNIEIYKADVSKRIEVKQMVDYILKKYGKIDALINNAGISGTKLFTDVTDEEWNKIVSELEEEKKEQLEEIIKLKQEIRYLKTQLDVVKDGKNEGSINNTDLLRRISNLEKVIYGKEE